MKLTIIVAIYNVKDYLFKNLESLRTQTVDDFKVFCVNDGSTDGSEKIIDEFVAKDKRFVRMDKKNGGLSDARNYGLGFVESDYVMFLDGDDFFEENMVELSLKKMEEDQLDMLVFGYNQYYTETGKKEVIHLGVADGTYCLKENKEILAYTPNAAWNKVYKTSLFKDNDIEYPFGYRHQDLGTTAKLMLEAKRIGYMDVPLYNYLIDRPNNITAQIDKKLYHIIDMSKEIMDYYQTKGVYQEYVDEFEYLVTRNFIQSLRKAMKLKDRKFVFQFIDDVFVTEKTYFRNSTHRYPLVETDGDSVYLNAWKCKLYYLYKSLKG